MPPKQTTKPEDGPPKSDRFVFRNGSKYEGEYAAAGGAVVRQGRGVYTEYLLALDPDDNPGMEPEERAGALAQVYDGLWNQDQFAEGRITYADGSFYEGRLDADGGYAEGRYVFADGSQWAGPFKACKMSGEGVFADKAGFKWRGVMAENQCVSMIQTQ